MVYKQNVETVIEKEQKYFASSEIQQEKARLRTKNYRKESQEKICEYLFAHPCVDCGEKDIILLEFDHILQEEKEYNVCQMPTDGFRWSLIEKEIQKCEVRCLTCHRKKTVKQQENYRVRWLRSNAA